MEKNQNFNVEKSKTKKEIHLHISKLFHLLDDGKGKKKSENANIVL